MRFESYLNFSFAGFTVFTTGYTEDIEVLFSFLFYHSVSSYALCGE
ncbi:hypothetical protein M125_2263 [Bacteroides fragilis str. 3998T(B)3]|uniref:Uncharacterized protein n=1 Tax=Bacteroides fragilis str. 3998T(B)3 TaxID=1339316 RepID=A0A015XEI7_BACFG|nr:hypothetical protein M125_2263 [Bacteroides fragilis str. 3998T(B)3]EXY95921.1 hypothetical protein M081_1971 [Bacteroides fragilis str. 3998 T(B) 4]